MNVKEYLAEIGRRGGQKSKGGGRPPIYKTDEERQAARKETQRKYRESKKGGKDNAGS
jgi:general stress protein YciG